MNHYLCPDDVDLDVFLDKLCDAGFKFVALTQRALEGRSTADISRSLRDHGLGVSSVNSAGFFLLEGEAARHQDRVNEQLIEVTAAFIGAKLNVIVGATTSLPLREARKRATGRLADFAARAQRAKVPLVVEPLSFLNVRSKSCFNSIRQMEYLMQDVPDLHITADLFHLWYDPDLEKLLSGHSVPVGLFQACDVRITGDNGVPARVPLGEGFIPWKEYIRAVSKTFPQIELEVELFINQLQGRDFNQILASSASELAALDDPHTQNGITRESRSHWA